MSTTDIPYYSSYEAVWGLPGDSQVLDATDPLHILVDAVFYLSMPALPDNEMLRGHLTVEYQPPGEYLPSDTMKVPILIVEYVKTNAFYGDGTDRHKDHLIMAMTSASALYRSLRISEPVFGLLIDRTEVYLLVGWRHDFSVSFSPLRIPG